MTGDDSAARRAFVFEQYRTYSSLGVQVEHIRRGLAEGVDLADMLVRETTDLLDSGMTREQLASALASTLVRLAAAGVDLAVDPQWRAVAEMLLLPDVTSGGPNTPNE